MEKFTFAQYLQFLEKSLSRQTGGEVNNGCQEIDELKSHTASAATMQRHLKQYRTVKTLVERYNVAF